MSLVYVMCTLNLHTGCQLDGILCHLMMEFYVYLMIRNPIDEVISTKYCKCATRNAVVTVVILMYTI